jgi:hypothetical protein
MATADETLVAATAVLQNLARDESIPGSSSPPFDYPTVPNRPNFPEKIVSLRQPSRPSLRPWCAACTIWNFKLSVTTISNSRRTPTRPHRLLERPARGISCGHLGSLACRPVKILTLCHSSKKRPRSPRTNHPWEKLTTNPMKKMITAPVSCERRISASSATTYKSRPRR